MGANTRRNATRTHLQPTAVGQAESQLKFLHAADVHLDSPLVGLERYADAPVEDLRGATRRALEALVDAAVEERVAFVILAGDLFDGDWKDYNTGLFFTQQMSKLAGAGIQVFVASGNHDAANQFTKSLKTPSVVRRFSTGHAESIRIPELEVAIHGRGFATKEVTDDLTAGFPDRIPGWFNIGVLHTSLNGRPGHATYAPCSLDGLLAKKYDYWALGHVHAREVVHEDPWVVFPGNTQGRHSREVGPKGCTVVSVTDGQVTEAREVHLDAVRWHHVVLDVSRESSIDDILARAADEMRACVAASDGRMAALRLSLQGSTRAHDKLVARPEHFTQELRAVALDSCGDQLWVEKVRLLTSKGHLAEVHDGEPETSANLVRTIQELTADQELVAAFTRQFLELRAKLPEELVGSEALEPVDPVSPVLLQRVIAEARDLLLARLGAQET